jgi:hypothetical protein
MKLGRTNRSLLGIPDRADEKLLQQQNEDLLQEGNDRKLEELAQTTAVIKILAKDIESGIDQSSRSLGFLVTFSKFVSLILLGERDV